MTERRSQWVALILAIGVITAAIPVSASELGGANTVLGSISGAGNVQVRGISVQQESTLFSDDRVRTGPGSYAKLSLANGARIELAGGSELVVKNETQGLRLNLISGAVTLKTSKAGMTLVISGHEVRPVADSSVRVTVLENSMADVQVVSGRAELKTSASKETVTIKSREQRIVNLKTGKIDAPVTQVASTLPAGAPPAGIPAPRLRLPATSNRASRPPPAGELRPASPCSMRNSSDGSPLSLSKLQGRELLEALTRAASLANIAAQNVISNATLIAQASPGNAAAANAIKNAATSTLANINSLTNQISQLTAQLNGASTQSQINSVLAQINSVANQLNQQIGILDGLIAQVNALGAKISAPPINPVEQVPTSASQSLP